MKAIVKNLTEFYATVFIPAILLVLILTGSWSATLVTAMMALMLYALPMIWLGWIVFVVWIVKMNTKYG